MRRVHPSAWGALLLGAGLAASAVPGTAQNAAAGANAGQPQFARSKDIYTGGATVTDGIKLGGWGSGTATEDRQYKTQGENSIKVETNGYYAGARIEFETPKEITDQKNDPYGLLEFVCRFQPGTLRNKNRQPGAPGGTSGAGEIPMQYQSDPSMGSAGGQQTITPDTQKLKVVLKCEEGTFVASNFPVSLTPAQEEGWFSVAVPFVAFKGLDKAATVKIKEIRIFGDTKDTFWIGEIRTTSDDEPINVEPLDAMEISVGEPVEFRAQATGGLSPLHYSWDFDASDGATQEDGVGPVVVHLFRKPSRDAPGQQGVPQPYVVTLTVRDLSGAKKPVRRTVDVIVNP